MSTDEISIWLIDTTATLPPERYSALLALLSPEEHLQGAQFRIASERYHYLLTRASVRTVLSRHVNIPAQDWRFRIGPYGKPSIANPSALARRISFNISHTRGLISVAVVARHAVGIDVEHVGRDIDLDVADFYFTANERNAMCKMPLSLQRERFLATWTLKESYIKARGQGLAIPLDKFGFQWDVHNEVGHIEFAAGFDDDAARWRFWQWRFPGGAHHVALCVATILGTDPLIIVRQMDLQGAETEWGRYAPFPMHRIIPDSSRSR